MSNIAEFLDSSRALEDEDISLSKSVLKIISTPNDEIEVGIMDFVKAVSKIQLRYRRLAKKRKFTGTFKRKEKREETVTNLNARDDTSQVCIKLKAQIWRYKHSKRESNND